MSTATEVIRDDGPATSRSTREFLPPPAVRKPAPAELGAALDYPSTEVGTVGDITVYYATSLGAQGQQLANDLLGVALPPYTDMAAYFGITSGQVSVIVAPLSGNNDGSGGAYHYGCDFTSGGTIYVDATFALANALDVEVSLYIAELSECCMGTQGKGWGCGSSNGEGLSRFFAAVDTPAGAFPAWGITGPSWVSAGYPDWVSTTEGTDRDSASTGCSVLYLYWMLSRGYGKQAIAEAAGATLADNYKTLTGKTTAYADLKAAVQPLTVNSDNPFAAVATGGVTCYGVDGTAGRVYYPDGNGHVHELAWENKWVNTGDLTAMTGAAPAASGSGLTCYGVSGTAARVYYLDANGHVHELAWENEWVNTGDLTAMTGAAPAAPGSALTCYGVGGTAARVYYLDANGHVHELAWENKWVNTGDLTAMTGAAPAASGSGLTCYGVSGTAARVYYVDAGGHVHELAWENKWVNTGDLTAMTGAAPAASGSGLTCYGVSGTAARVYYVDAGGHVHELAWENKWVNTGDLTAMTGATASAPKGPLTCYGVSGTAARVYYLDGGGDVHELAWENKWVNTGNLTAMTAGAVAAPGSALMCYGVSGTAARVYYLDIGGDLHELAWENKWVNTGDLTALTRATRA